jgi:glucosamine--fructose-6-phosphate aminotransferase (isomerizing)
MPARATQRFGDRLAAELREAPDAVRRQVDCLADPLERLITELLRRPPNVVVTCARGSSAHAATFAKHLIERHLGIPVAPAAPNIASVYHSRLRLKAQLFLTISQSGRSDDLIAAATMARIEGALTAALVNDPKSPLASACDIVLPMSAGPEHSVAATKSFVASLAALLRMTAMWTGDDSMLASCDRLSKRLAQAAELDWSEALRPLARAISLVAVGRGPTLAIAREAALKLKETCTLQAEAFSSAEFLHGPIALVSSGYPVMVFAPTDESAAGVGDLVTDLQRKGACVILAGHGDEPTSERKRPISLPVLASDRADADAICLIQSFYAFLVRLAQERGADVEAPRHLQKITRTR